MTAAVVMVALVSSAAFAGSTTWKLSSFNTSGRALRAQVAAVASDGSVSFTFPVAPNAAYLLSTKVPSSGSLSATVSIADTGTGTTFAYYPNGSPAMVGLYFETKSSGGFNPSDYWWSGSSRVSLATLVNTPTLLSTALSDPSSWTNYYGKPGNQTGTYVVNGTTYPSPADGFAAAVANMDSWGVSFGGGSFFANGVGTPTGSAIFTLHP
jgi:hypothetical protein